MDVKTGDTTTTENPASAAAPSAARPSGGRVDLEAAVALLNVKDGSEVETMETLERLMIAREAELRAELRAEFDAKLESAAPLSAAVRSAVAHLTEAPLNYHQATVMYAAETGGGDGETARNTLVLRCAGSLVLSALMVLMQCMVVMGVLVGTLLPACASSDQCEQKGTYCTVDFRNRCEFCGERVPLPEQTDPASGGTLNNAMQRNYAGFNLTLVAEACAAPTDRFGRETWYLFPRAAVVSWCETCVFNDGQVDELTVPILGQANVAAMGSFDWVALFFATIVVALSICGELKVSRE